MESTAGDECLANLPKEVSNVWIRRDSSHRAFKVFRESFAKEYFQKHQSIAPSTLEGWYVSSHSLCICPGGRQGGGDPNLVEVFFGARPHENVQSSSEVGPTVSQKKFIVEAGASLSYQYLQDGTVIVLLYPASSDFNNQPYDCILLDVFPTAEKLLKPRKLKKHWLILMSCMATTSLSGATRFVDKWRMFNVLDWHSRYSDKKLIPPAGPLRIQKVSTQFFAWFFGVALSGVAVFGFHTWANSRAPNTVTPLATSVITQLRNSSEQSHKDLSKTNTQLGEIKEQIRSLSKSQTKIKENDAVKAKTKTP